MKKGVHQGYVVNRLKDVERRFECLDGSVAHGLMLYFENEHRHIEMKECRHDKDIGLGLSKSSADKNWYVNDYKGNMTSEVLK
jgi:hypothetical protein